jgi:beclin 1
VHQSGEAGPKVSVDVPAMSFYELSESEVTSPGESHDKDETKLHELDPDVTNAREETSMTREMDSITRLFEILSARSDIDYPICVECTDVLIDSMQKKLELASRERDAYASMLKRLKAESPSADEVAASQSSLEAAQAAEASAYEELLALEQQQRAVDSDISALEAEARALDRDEEAFWASHNALTTTLAGVAEARASTAAKASHDAAQLRALQRTNVYNDAFCISHDGTFATINGLRLGRTAAVPVEWSEINAAWGHALLLLSTMADGLSFAFSGYELQPMGSTSRIVRLNTTGPRPRRIVLDLFSSGDLPLGLPFLHRRFDAAMVAFLACLRQLGDFVAAETRRAGRPLVLPYAIAGDRIDGLCIRLARARDYDWSAACKMTLTCCKFLLAHTSNVDVLGAAVV